MNNNIIASWVIMKIITKSIFVIVIMVSYSLLIFFTKCNVIIMLILLGITIIIILGVVYSETMKKVKPITNLSTELVIPLTTIIKNDTGSIMLTSSNNLGKFQNILESVTLLEIINNNPESNIYFNKINTTDFLTGLSVHIDKQLLYNIDKSMYFIEFKCNKLLLEQAILQICNNQTNELPYV